jgi:hypothetical protein
VKTGDPEKRSQIMSSEATESPDQVDVALRRRRALVATLSVGAVLVLWVIGAATARAAIPALGDYGCSSSGLSTLRILPNHHYKYHQGKSRNFSNDQKGDYEVLSSHLIHFTSGRLATGPGPGYKARWQSGSGHENQYLDLFGKYLYPISCRGL